MLRSGTNLSPVLLMRPSLLALSLLSALSLNALAAALPIVSEVEWQPFVAQVRRLIEATDYLGAPFSAADKVALNTAMASPDHKAAVVKLQQTLDRYALLGVHINPEMRVKVAAGDAKPELMQDGWRQFLVKVANESGTTAPLAAVSPNAQSVHNVRAAATPPTSCAASRASRPRSSSPTSGSTSALTMPSRSGPRSAASPSSIASCSSTAATPASARRRLASTSAKARRTSVSATRWICFSPVCPRRKSRSV